MEEEKNDSENKNFDDLLGIDFLDDLKIDNEKLEILKKKFGTVIADFIEEGYRYAGEEKRILNIKDHAVKSIGDLLIQNILSTRSFLLTITGFSLAAIGAIFSVIASSNQTIFTYLWLMYIGLGMLGLCVIFSLIYLLQKMTTDNQKLSQDLKFQRSATEELHSLLIQYVEEHKPYVEYIKVREPLQKEFREREKKIIGEEQKNLTEKIGQSML